MLSLTDNSQDEIKHNGHVYVPNLCFDNVLQFYKLMDDDDVSQSDKVLFAFESFYGQEALEHVVDNEDTDFLIEAVQIVTDYINEDPYGQFQTGVGSDTPNRSFSYIQDAEMIYAGFMQQYGIDLVEEQGKMHWDKFKALLHGLTDKTLFKQIIQIRETETNDIEDQKEVQHIRELQDYYALTEGMSVEDQAQSQDDIFAGIVGAVEGG
ncbi:Gp15 family bacteriophage protein [Ligilactobacillus acidipiscis]|uniref:Phage protein n=1 Tax=Ligilactobacillus acidipiscis TaxID=89059 RepID=A0A1K1KNZ4_9LACO|nr:Gp15 family bacteriophage protein [Ligilactobacillus acidipiscis]SFV40566.1 Phage protein [Ligilactobacillus acidipiscis]